MLLTNNLYKHGNMAVDYLKRASVYLHDAEKVQIKQHAYLTLLANIHQFLKQQITPAPYQHKDQVFEYDSFIQSALIKKGNSKLIISPLLLSEKFAIISPRVC